MKQWQFYTALCLGVLCVALSVAIVGMAYSNQQFQKELQNSQAKINNGILGPQAQQIIGNVIQEMAAVAATNSRMRALLQKHGLQQESANQPAPEARLPAEGNGQGPASAPTAGRTTSSVGE